MREIGELGSEEQARLFVDYLLTRKVEGEADRLPSGRWSVWVHDEDQCERAGRWLREFASDPASQRFAGAERVASAMRKEDQAREQKWRRRQRRLSGRSVIQRPGLGAATLAVVLLCVGVFVLQLLFPEKVTPWLYISNFRSGLPEIVDRFQIWRLVTPALMHGSLVHLLFNLWWLWDLGRILEWKMGAWPLVLTMSAIALISNLAQYFATGPAFMGASGVVFGLLGFIWMKGRVDPGYGLALPRGVAIFMLAILALGWIGFFEVMRISVANTAHTAGLLAGMACSFSPWPRARR